MVTSCGAALQAAQATKTIQSKAFFIEAPIRMGSLAQL
jgi:hypothetical protein